MKSDKKKVTEDTGMEILAALNILESEQGIKKSVMVEAIRDALMIACVKHFGRNDNIEVIIDPDTCQYKVNRIRTVVENVEDDECEISLTDARDKYGICMLGDTVKEDIKTKEFCRIAAGQARQNITQKIREESKKALYEIYHEKESELITGVVERFQGNKMIINIGKVDATLSEAEQVKGERYHLADHIKVYILEVKEGNRNPAVLVSRSHPNLVKRLFEAEVAEVRDGTVEIKAISREAGSRSKIAVWSNDENVDPIGACVGEKSSRVNRVVDELNGEKIDIINWDENPAILIENALSPAKVIFVMADEDEKSAQVVVPDYQLSLAIGKEGQNARLAAKLTGYKIDIKSETQAREMGLFDELGIDDQYVGYGEYTSYDEDEEEFEYEEEDDITDSEIPQDVEASDEASDSLE